MTIIVCSLLYQRGWKSLYAFAYSRPQRMSYNSNSTKRKFLPLESRKVIMKKKCGIFLDTNFFLLFLPPKAIHIISTTDCPSVEGVMEFWGHVTHSHLWKKINDSVSIKMAETSFFSLVNCKILPRLQKKKSRSTLTTNWKSETSDTIIWPK